MVSARIPWFYRLAIFSLLALCLIPFPDASAQAGLTGIADGVYAYVDVRNMSPANSYGANAGVIVGRDGVLVVDTLVSAKEANRLLGDIAKITKKPVKYAVNTHWHADHAFGNSQFMKRGATVVGHVSERGRLAQYGEMILRKPGDFGMTAKDLEGTTIAVPTIAFSEKMYIDLGDKKVELIHLAPSHSPGSIIVYLPEQRIIFAGDIIFNGYHAFVGEGDIDGWLAVLDWIMGMDVDIIIPGHGPVATKQDAAAMKEYLIIFDKTASELCAASKDVDYIAAELLKVLPPRAEGGHLIKSSIIHKYLKR